MSSMFRFRSVAVLAIAGGLILGFGACGDRAAEPKGAQAPASDPAATTIAHEAPPPALDQHVKVTGSPEALATFNGKLLALLNVASPSGAFIACNECSKLGTGTPPSELNYYYAAEHKSKPENFKSAEAFVNATPDKVVMSEPDTNTADLKGPACPASPPAPPGCKSAPWCVETNGCDKTFSVPNCQKCE